MDQIQDVSPECIPIKGEQSIMLRKKGDQEKDAKIVLTSSVSLFYTQIHFGIRLNIQIMLFMLSLKEAGWN